MKRKWEAAVAAACVMLAIAAWALGWFDRSEDPVVAQIKALSKAPPSDANRRAVGAAIQERTEGMTDEQRMQYFFDTLGPVMMPMMAQRFEQEYDKFMKLSPEERQREMDKRIDQMQKGGAPPGAGGRQPSQMDPAKMDEMRKKMLDWVTPSQRAKFENGMKMWGDRMKQRGITPPPMPGGGFF